MIKDPVIVSVAFGANASLADTPIFVCPEGAEYEVTEINERHEVLGTDGGAVTMDVTKASSGTAVSAGTSLLQSEFDLKATAATNVRKTTANSGLVTAQGTRTLTAGQALGLNFTGTLTSVAGLTVTAVLTMQRPAQNRR